MRAEDQEMFSCLLCLEILQKSDKIELSEKIGERTVRDAISEHFINHEVSSEFSHLPPTLKLNFALAASPQRLILHHLQILLQELRRVLQFPAHGEHQAQLPQNQHKKRG